MKYPVFLFCLLSFLLLDAPITAASRIIDFRATFRVTMEGEVVSVVKLDNGVTVITFRDNCDQKIKEVYGEVSIVLQKGDSVRMRVKTDGVHHRLVNKDELRCFCEVIEVMCAPVVLLGWIQR